MKRVIGWALLILFFAALYAGFAAILAISQYHWAVVVFVPLCPFVGATLLVAFSELISWLLK